MSRPSVRAPNTRRMLARAKINLFLRVLGRRDDGFHDLETLILPIDLADRLAIHAHADPTEFRTLSLALEVTGDEEVARRVPADESNLVLRAAQELALEAGVRGFADITLEKRVPVAAGLGGGSADAAVTLRALDDLWGCALSASTLVAVAARVGSDVPALLASAPVFVRGRGDRVHAASVSVPLRWVLVTFSFGVRTVDAFRWWDENGGETGPRPDAILEEVGRTSASPTAFAPGLYNDLEGPVGRRHPEISHVRRLLLEAGALASVMCGSGPTVVGLLAGDGPALARDALQELERICGRPVREVRSMPGVGRR